jgi:hypothetical protein
LAFNSAKGIASHFLVIADSKSVDVTSVIQAFKIIHETIFHKISLEGVFPHFSVVSDFILDNAASAVALISNFSPYLNCLSLEALILANQVFLGILLNL